jgi:hypothetical protein
MINTGHRRLFSEGWRWSKSPSQASSILFSSENTANGRLFKISSDFALIGLYRGIEPDRSRRVHAAFFQNEQFL